MKSLKKILALLLTVSMLAGLLGTAVFAADVDEGEEVIETPVEGITEEHEHMLIQIVAVDATCEADGNIEYWICFNCGETFSDENAEHEVTELVIEAPGHKRSEPVRDVLHPATCTEEGDGYDITYCEVCGEELEYEYVIISKLAHTPGETVIENEIPATCSMEGSHDEAVYCTVCCELISRSENVSDSKLAHTPGETVRENVVEPTCTVPGSHDEAVYCTVCGEELSRENKTDVVSHTPGEAVIENAVAPKCEVDGSYDKVVYCTVCEKELSRETVADPHPGHTLGGSVQENPADPTCEEDGGYDTVWYCAVCGEELARVHTAIVATGHQHTEVRGYVAPTDITDGKTGETWCTDCNKLIKEDEVIPCGHSFEATVVAPTCTEAGYTVHNCTEHADCEKSYTDSYVPATGHDYEVYEVVAPSCTEPGFTIYVCRNDESHRNTDNYVPATGHQHTEVRGAVSATPTTPGYTGDTVCTDCGTVLAQGRVTPATGIPSFNPPVGGGVIIDDEDVPLASVLPFDDVAETDWFHDAVAFVYDKELMVGVSDNRFAPHSEITRGMIVTILYRMEGSPAASAATFNDVAAGQWYAEAVAWAAANGIVLGYGDGSFRPTQSITREEMAAILYRYAAFKSYDVTVAADAVLNFNDADAVSNYARTSVLWAVEKGLIGAVDGGTISARSDANRAQAASSLMNFCEKIADVK